VRVLVKAIDLAGGLVTKAVFMVSDSVAAEL